MADPLTKVRFKFTSAGDPDTSWRVVRMHVREALSEPYAAEFDLACENLLADPDALLGRDCAALWFRDDHQRRLQGVVHRVEHLGLKAGHLLCRVHVAPALLALGQRRDCYIFQDVTALEAVAVVLAEGFAPWQRTTRIDVQRALPTREYFVQYNESDLDFVARLLAEEGVGYYFDHAGDREEMVLFDANSTCAAIATMDGAAVCIQGPEGGTAVVETLRDFDPISTLRSTSSVVRDFNWTQPSLDLTREARGVDPNGLDREVYEYPGPLTINSYSNPAYAQEDGAAQSRLRRQQFAAGERRAAGAGYVTTFTPGFTFDLTGHLNPATDGTWLVTRAEHFGHAPEELTSDTHDDDEGRHERYRNTFEALPVEVPWRPARSFVRPRIGGVQTATVVGPAGEEIYTDEHGRVKVQFHWDRKGERDESSSLWVRVAQAWAGNGWGFVFVPRIGMEVVVQFLEGNPDRPLVTGCVYNGENRPPYPLPDEKTKSTVKSNSTLGGGGYNELRFEDLKGSEEVFLHAQKDFNEVVEHDHSTLVHHDQRNTVDNNQTERVGANQTMTVGGNRTSHVYGNEKKTVEKDQTDHVVKNRTHTVDLDEKITVGLNQTTAVGVNRTETVGANETVTIGGNETRSIAGNLMTTVGVAELRAIGAMRMTTVGAADATTVGGAWIVTAGGPCLISSGALVRQSVGGSSTSVRDSKIGITAPAEVKLTCGSSAITMTPGKVTITSGAGATITLNGTDVKIEGVNIELQAAANGKFIAGAALDLNGMLTTIIGNPVKINC